MVNDKGYHQLQIWHKSRSLIVLIYQITEKFPKSELFGLTSQIRRAAISVLLNIVEGDRRRSRKEFIRFLDIADGSLTEVEACLEIASDLHYLSDEELKSVEEMRGELAAMLSGFIKAVSKAL